MRRVISAPNTHLILRVSPSLRPLRRKHRLLELSTNASRGLTSFFGVLLAISSPGLVLPLCVGSQHRVPKHGSATCTRCSYALDLSIDTNLGSFNSYFTSLRNARHGATATQTQTRG